MRTSARYPVFEARFPPRVRFISPSEETTDARPAATLIPQLLFSLPVEVTWRSFCLSADVDGREKVAKAEPRGSMACSSHTGASGALRFGMTASIQTRHGTVRADDVGGVLALELQGSHHGPCLLDRSTHDGR